MSDMEDFPQFYDTVKIAKLFSVTTETVRNWLNDGKFPNHKRVGRKWLIPESDVMALLHSTYGEKPVQP